jgi:hypothetical protein
MCSERLLTPEEGEIYTSGSSFKLRRPGGQTIMLVPVTPTSPVLHLPPQSAPTTEELVRRARCVVAKAESEGRRVQPTTIPAKAVSCGLTLLNLYDGQPVEPCESCASLIRFTLTCTDDLPTHRSCSCRLRRPSHFRGELQYSFANNWRGYYFWPRKGEVFLNGLERPSRGAESATYPDMRRPGEKGGREDLWDTERWDAYDWEVMVHNPLRAAKVRNQLGVMLRFLSFLSDLARRDETAIPPDVRCIADSVGLSLLPVDLALFFGGDLQVLLDMGYPRKALDCLSAEEYDVVGRAAVGREKSMVKGTWRLRAFRPELAPKILVRTRTQPDASMPVYREQIP